MIDTAQFSMIYVLCKGGGVMIIRSGRFRNEEFVVLGEAETVEFLPLYNELRGFNDPSFWTWMPGVFYGNDKGEFDYIRTRGDSNIPLSDACLMLNRSCVETLFSDLENHLRGAVLYPVAPAIPPAKDAFGEAANPLPYFRQGDLEKLRRIISTAKPVIITFADPTAHYRVEL